LAKDFDFTNSFCFQTKSLVLLGIRFKFFVRIADEKTNMDIFKLWVILKDNLTKVTLMENILNNDIKSKIKGLAIYQIAGGIIGIGLTIWLIAQTVTITGLVILVFILAAGLYSFSIYCGKQLIKGKIKSGLRLSTINQALQVINFAVLGFAFKFVAGVILFVGIDYTNDFNIIFNFSLSEFQFNINSHNELVTVGFNVVAIFLIYLIDKLQQEIENRETLFKTSENIDTFAESSTTEENL